MRIRRFAVAAVLAVAWPAQACTLCHTPTARDVRHQVFAHDFAAHLLALALPLPLLLAGIHLAGREPRRGTRP